MSRPPSHPSSSTTVLRDRYEVGDVIGAGGSAEVRAAHDRVLDRPVAIKLLAAAAAESADPRAHERFVREARSSAGFTHRHAVATYDAGEDDGQLFIVMELVDGPSLAGLIAASAPMSESEIVRIGTQVLDALAAAHSAGLVHRDVKPANILLDRSGNVKLADFGIAKRFDEMADGLTADGMVVGTHDYLAPEQAAGAEAGPAVDIYALGVVLWEMATGQRPVRGTVPDLRAVRPDVSAALAATITEALAPRPGDRFGSAREMAASLSGAPLPTELSIVEPASTATRPITATTAPMTAARDHPGPSDPTVVASSIAPGRLGPHEFASPRWWPFALVAAVVALIGAFAFAQRDDDVIGDSAAAPTGPPVTTAAAVPLGQVPTTLAATTPSAPLPTDGGPAAGPGPDENRGPEEDRGRDNDDERDDDEGDEGNDDDGDDGDDDEGDDELPSGFTGTDELDEFIDQLRSAGTAGPQSSKLAEKLEELSESDKNPGHLRKDIEKVADEIDKWVESGELDPPVAEQARRFLTRLAR